MSSNNDAAAAAAAAAAAKAAQQITIEIWTLYAIGVTATLIRVYARIKAVGIKDLKLDDYLAALAIIFYTSQSTLGYCVGYVSHGLANNSMTDAERAALSVDDPEYHMRVVGSQIQVAGWTSYTLLICTLKLSVLAFYLRLTEGLGRAYLIRIYAGFGLVLATLVASVMTIYLACRPFQNYWQVSPDPGNVCQGAVSRPIVWVTFSSNICTDLYLLMIPLPMLWNSSLRLYKKIASTIILGAGVFVLVCATLKSIFVLVDEANGAELAGEWGIRECFTAIITTNLPMIFPLFKSWATRVFGTSIDSLNKSYKTPTGIRTIGGGGASSRGRRGPPSANPITALTFTESEERIVDDINLNSFKESKAGIIVLNKVEVTREDRSREERERNVVHGAHETW